MSDLVQRLREITGFRDCREAADRIEAQEREIARLWELLRACPSYLASLEARITHPCPLLDGTRKLRHAIDAAMQGKQR